jgi:hypothetical protein
LLGERGSKIEWSDRGRQREWQQHVQGFVERFLRERPKRLLRRRLAAEETLEYLARYIRHSAFLDATAEAGPEPEQIATADQIHVVFAHFGLKPRNPVHCGFFLAIAADLYFNTPVRGRPKGTRARDRVWTEFRLSQLGAMLKTLESMYPGANDGELSEILKQKSISAPAADTLRKRFAKARRAYASTLEG